MVHASFMCFFCVRCDDFALYCLSLGRGFEWVFFVFVMAGIVPIKFAVINGVLIQCMRLSRLDYMGRIY